MTMPKFEPVAMIGGHGHPRHLSYLQSATEARLYGAMKPLYTADQLTEAYEAGRQAEREACAAYFDNASKVTDVNSRANTRHIYIAVATSIRARSTK